MSECPSVRASGAPTTPESPLERFERPFSPARCTPVRHTGIWMSQVPATSPAGARVFEHLRHPDVQRHLRAKAQMPRTSGPRSRDVRTYRRSDIQMSVCPRWLRSAQPSGARHEERLDTQMSVCPGARASRRSDVRASRVEMQGHLNAETSPTSLDPGHTDARMSGHTDVWPFRHLRHTDLSDVSTARPHATSLMSRCPDIQTSRCRRHRRRLVFTSPAHGTRQTRPRVASPTTGHT
jgi:hypothetical protein